MPAETHPSPTQAISRNEIYWLAAAVIFGAIVRLSFPGRMAIEHFDEGVYASNFWFGPDQDYSYPARYLYAPPLLPAAIEWTMIFASICGIRSDGFIPMIPTLVAGIAMIPSIWWVGRGWFGPSAGLISAWLVATSNFHASYTRAALTDVPVCLFILWAVYFIEKTLVRSVSISVAVPHRKTSKRGSAAWRYPWREILLAGGFTGLAWWTKYNGWLPLAIGSAGGLFWQFLTPAAERQIRRTLVCLTMIGVVAAIVWAPVLWDLQKHGGYASVAANHRNYVVGFKGWGDSALKQAEHVGLYDNWFGMFTESSRATTRDDARYLRHESLWDAIRYVWSPGNRKHWLWVIAHKIAWWANRFAIFAIPIALLAITGFALRLRIRIRAGGHQSPAACLLAAWFCGMTAATPMYYPYPRLVFPWLIATWLGVGLAVQHWRNRSTMNVEGLMARTVRPWSPGKVEWILVVWLTANFIVRSLEGTSDALRDRTSLADAATQLTRKIEQKIGGPRFSKDELIIYVWGEPALVFGLRLSGFAYVAPVQNLDFIGKTQPLPTFVAFGPHAFESQDFEVQRKKLDQCRFCQLLHPDLSPLVTMDSPQKTKKSDVFKSPVNSPTVWLYQVLD